MKRKIYTLVSSAKQKLFSLALLLTVCSGALRAQTTYTFNFTGGQQTISLPAGSYSVQCWGAIGGWHANDPSMLRGKGGYSNGTLNLTTTTTLYISAGGAGGTQVSNSVPGGWNGGGPGKYYSYAFNSGGGASHVATASGVLSSLSSNTAAVLIVAGGGAGGATNQTPGNGGGLSGGNSTRSGCTGGTQTLPGASSISGGSATFGQGWDASLSSGSYGAGGGGWYGGGCESGGSGYIGGVTSGTTIAFGQTGYVANPDITGNGLVLITELCNFSLYAAGPSSSLNPVICSGQSATLMTSAISNYSWSTGATSSSLIVSPTTSTVYALTATSPSNCTTSRTISVTVSAGLPVLSIANPSNNICLGQTATLTASGALTYTWTNAGVVNGQTFTPNSTAVYTVTGQNGCGTAVATTTVNVAPLSVTTTASPALVCEGYTAALTGLSAVNGYTWMPGAQTGSLITVAPNATTIYTVTASDGICAGTQTVLVTTKTTPVITTSQTLTNICMGQSVTLSASGAGIGGTYSWTPGGVGSSIMLSPSTSTSVLVAGTNSLNCTASAQQIILVSQPPSLAVTANKFAVCTGDQVILTASGAPNYQWANGPTTANYTVNPTITTIYTVTGSQTTNSCTIDATIAINAIVPNVSITSTLAVCAGGSVAIVASGASMYKWNGGINSTNGTYITTPAASSVFTLVATTTSFNVNCLTTQYSTVTVNANPTLSVTSAKATICKGETHTLTATGASSYTWSASAATGSVITVKPTTTTIYTVTGVDDNGCENTIIYSAKVSSCLGIEENTLQQMLSVYPNPNNGQFFVSSDKAIRLNIISTLGQVVRTIELTTENNFTVEVSGLAKGVYYLSSGNGSTPSSNTKLIVN